ncbi:hypothetical protein F5Y16DRAFT_356859 [Xylariaceae sp. FL0255]|nr:hypothetical protein F5Y16DRAFT_356859 [Xylariaceae sp. FL0255]
MGAHRYFSLRAERRLPRPDRTVNSPSESVRRLRNLWLDTWLWEALAGVLSGTCFILIIIILKFYDQNPVPQFAYGITLNAIISILATFSKSSLLVAVAASISQLKWTWYRSSEGKSLYHMQLFDDASRGPWGSLILLSRACKWPLASIGAFASFSALSFDPSIQQIIFYSSRSGITSDRADQASNISRARTFVADAANKTAILDVQQVVTSALWGLSSDTNGQWAARCPTGNCTWDEFESLALCSRCENITLSSPIPGCSFSWEASAVNKALADIDKSEGINIPKSCSLRFPSEFTCNVAPKFSIYADLLKNETDRRWYATGVIFPSHIFGGEVALGVLKDVKDGPNGPTFMTEDGKQKSDPWNALSFCDVELESGSAHGSTSLYIKQATACQMTPCVKKYSFSMSRGIPTLKTLEHRNGSWYLNATGLLYSKGRLYDAASGQLFQREIEPSWSEVVGENGRIIGLSDNAEMPFNKTLPSFSTSSSNLFPLYNIYNWLSGQMTVEDRFVVDETSIVTSSSGVHFNEQSLAAHGPASPFIDPQILNLQRITNQGGLTWAIPRIAARLTSYLREKEGIPVAGKSQAILTVVEVRWYWLIFPGFTWTIGMAFVWTTMWVCRRDSQSLWKTSSLPLIYHGLDAQDVAFVDANATETEKVSSMKRQARKLHAKFQNSSGQGHLKLEKLQ